MTSRYFKCDLNVQKYSNIFESFQSFHNTITSPKRFYRCQLVTWRPVDIGPVGDLVIGVLSLAPAIMRCQRAGRRLRAGNQIVGTVGVIQLGLTGVTQTGTCRVPCIK